MTCDVVTLLCLYFGVQNSSYLVTVHNVNIMDEKAIKLFESIFLSYRLSPIHLLIRIIFDLLERFRTYEIFSEQPTNKRQTCR